MKRKEECFCCGHIYTSENEEPDYASAYPPEIILINWECAICRAKRKLCQTGAEAGGLH